MNSLKIGNLQLNTNVSLSPMAGVTDFVLRSLVRKYSQDCLLTTEMISSEALINESKCKKRDMISENVLIKRAQNHSPISYQLTGHKPDLMVQSAKILEKYADIIDINMGCPVNKVVKGQDGSALMRNTKLAKEIVSAVKSSISKPVSVKIRLGYCHEEMNYVEFGQEMQDAGADLITIHARTRSQMYSGNADWEKIFYLKKSVDVPVIANGDIKSVEDAIKCIELSHADGVAVGRASMGDPSLIFRIDNYFKTGKILEKPNLEARIEDLKTILNEEINLRGEDVGIKFTRKYYPFFLNGVHKASKYRAELVLENNYDNIIKRLDDFLYETKHALQ